MERLAAILNEAGIPYTGKEGKRIDVAVGDLFVELSHAGEWVVIGASLADGAALHPGFAGSLVLENGDLPF